MAVKTHELVEIERRRDNDDPSDELFTIRFLDPELGSNDDESQLTAETTLDRAELQDVADRINAMLMQIELREQGVAGRRTALVREDTGGVYINDSEVDD
jgi:hypothetical protein